MVSHSGTSSRTHDLRPLNEPRTMDVIVHDRQPVMLVINRQQHPIHIQDTWIIEDEWWRQSISRQYFSVVLENGKLVTIFYDRVNDRWFSQDY